MGPWLRSSVEQTAGLASILPGFGHLLLIKSSHSAVSLECPVVLGAVPATCGPHCSNEETEAPDLLRATELDQIACASCLLLLLTLPPFNSIA